MYELDGGRWRAVNQHDESLVIEHDEWPELFMTCVAVRIRRVIRQATDELMERQLAARGRGPDRHTRTPGPLGGVNA